MDVREMPAGREIDALVAEGVMGQEPAQWTNGLGETGVTFFTHVEPYSTDIAAAWEVVEKLGMEVLNKCHNMKWLEEHGKWMCCAGCFKAGGSAEYEAFADTAPLAICRAALLTVE